MTDSEYAVARVSIGYQGTKPDGNPAEMVIVEYALPSGLHSTDNWEMDDEDRELMQRIADHVEAKIKAMRAGNEEFRTSAQVMGFNPDKKDLGP